MMQDLPIDIDSVGYQLLNILEVKEQTAQAHFWNRRSVAVWPTKPLLRNKFWIGYFRHN